METTTNNATTIGSAADVTYILIDVNGNRSRVTERNGVVIRSIPICATHDCVRAARDADGLCELHRWR